MISPVLVIQTRIMRSSEPETTRVPSGDNHTMSMWLSNGPAIGMLTGGLGVPDANQIAQAREPGATHLPSGKNATKKRLCPCGLEIYRALLVTSRKQETGIGTALRQSSLEAKMAVPINGYVACWLILGCKIRQQSDCCPVHKIVYLGS